MILSSKTTLPMNVPVTQLVSFLPNTDGDEIVYKLQTFIVIREATYEEWRAEYFFDCEVRGLTPIPPEITKQNRNYFYEIQTD